MWTQLPSPKGAQPHPIFGPYLLWPNSCMDQDVTWYGARPETRRLFVRWGPHSPSPKGDRAPLPNFRRICIVANGWMHQDTNWCGGRPQPMCLCVRRGPTHPLNFRPVYYGYCDFVRTLHSRYWFVQVQVQVLYAFYFLKKSLILLSLFQYKYAMHCCTP